MGSNKEEDSTQKIEPAPSNGVNSCLKILLIIGAACLPLLVLAVLGIFIYIANHQNKLASVSATPVPAQTSSEVKKTETKKTAKKIEQEQAVEENSENQTSDANPQSDTKDTSQGVIDYFIDTAAYDYTKREMYITRWNTSSVSVGVAEGEFNDSLNNCLASFISDFNSQSSSAKLIRNDTVALGIPNIKIYYWDNDVFKDRAGSIEYGFTEWIHKDDKSLQRSMLFLSTKVMEMDEAVRCQVIRHEMMHAVGFWGHSDKYFEGIMSLPKTRYIYPDEDKQIVRMLYNTGINIGANASSARSFLQGKSW